VWRRAAAVVLGALCLVAPVACGGDEPEPEAPPPPTVPVDEGLHVRTEDRMIAGLRSVVVRPSADGPFPLVVFVHGAGAPPEFYGDLLEELAAAGNVVVAPAMPGSVDHSDFTALAALPFQPGRVRDVIDAVTTGDQVIHAADPERIVVMGHSLGGMTALATAFNTCCRDSRVDAVVSIAGELAPFPDGIYGLGSVPLLLVHGQHDDTVPIRGSQHALAEVGTSAYLLTVVDGGHGEYLGRDADAHPAVLAAMLAFLDATVGGDPAGGLADLRTAGRTPGVRLTSRE
jgi:pimeloyl-ACP methyl ester carboxylesterase